ncbi:cation:proton antiporter subunit C [Parvularcula flava]|uniref:Cation:proton antiporter subunit C n=1 Tax=Aquisalinus luteolus TaxID=1566827 RepID=A0A8J3AAB1_9PROT|nr:cation:proton antiporter subunit C [Aquisalinus luteolus]NHK29561.1 cation:proton antiporter subunit C [Aquisalinus luteolus]GGI01572.1 sodium:proton antiporter [Aquisalinus luteolus]
MDIIEFIVGRYNYWIFITLMMMGLYIVISRGNLVKTIVGLNLFQTSVFIFYISIGKIVGGTAPIIVGNYKADDSYGDGHGDGYGADATVTDHGNSGASENLHDTDGLDLPSNSLSADVPAGGEVSAASGSLHQMPETAADMASGTDAAYASVADAAAQGAEVIYTNPLPHVLILTAIVVGVATTAVGLALAVRIREAYGTIEEDELEAEDHFAEFGVPLHPEQGQGRGQGSQTQGGAA